MKKKLLSILNSSEKDPENRNKMNKLFSILENINQFDKSKNLIDILPLFEKNKLELEEMRKYLEQLRDRNDWLEKNCKYGNNETTEVEETRSEDGSESESESEEEDDNEEEQNILRNLLLYSSSGGNRKNNIIKPPLPKYAFSPLSLLPNMIPYEEKVEEMEELPHIETYSPINVTNKVSLDHNLQTQMNKHKTYK